MLLWSLLMAICSQFHVQHLIKLQRAKCGINFAKKISHFYCMYRVIEEKLCGDPRRVKSNRVLVDKSHRRQCWTESGKWMQVGSAGRGECMPHLKRGPLFHSDRLLPGKSSEAKCDLLREARNMRFSVIAPQVLNVHHYFKKNSNM